VVVDRVTDCVFVGELVNECVGVWDGVAVDVPDMVGVSDMVVVGVDVLEIEFDAVRENDGLAVMECVGDAVGEDDGVNVTVLLGVDVAEYVAVLEGVEV
jgi:hypothetical protein